MPKKDNKEKPKDHTPHIIDDAKIFKSTDNLEEVFYQLYDHAKERGQDSVDGIAFVATIVRMGLLRDDPRIA